MSDCPPRSTLERFLAAGLGGQNAEDVCAHVEECSACQAELHNLVEGSSVGPEVANYATARNHELDSSFLKRLHQAVTDVDRRPPRGINTGQRVGRPIASDQKPALEDKGLIAGYEIIGELGRGAMGVV
jgi:hypothetical protein